MVGSPSVHEEFKVQVTTIRPVYFLQQVFFFLVKKIESILKLL
jgi:hypothetical protein